MRAVERRRGVVIHADKIILAKAESSLSLSLSPPFVFLLHPRPRLSLLRPSAHPLRTRPAFLTPIALLFPYARGPSLTWQPFKERPTTTITTSHCMHANTLYNGDCYAYWKVPVAVPMIGKRKKKRREKRIYIWSYRGIILMPV